MARIAAIVLNNVLRDARVLREAQTLREAGHSVEIFGITSDARPSSLLWEGVVIRWVPHSLHTRGMTGISLMVSVLIVLAIALAVFVPTILLLDDVGTINLPDPSRMKLKHFLALGLGFTACAVAAAAAFKLRSTLKKNVNSIRITMSYLKNEYQLRTNYNYSNSTIEHPETITKYSPSLYDKVRNFFDKENRLWIFRMHGMHRAFLSYIDPMAYDVIHCHDFTTLPVGISLKKSNPKLKLVYDSHEFFSAVSHGNPDRARWVKHFEAVYSSEIDACITVNDSIAQLLQRSYPRLPAPVVICNATPVPEFMPENDGRLHLAAGLPPETRILLFQGGLADHRGLLQLTESVASLKPDWALVFMAWGPFERDIRRHIDSLDRMVPMTSQRIRFVAPVSQSELAAWTAGATLGAILYEPSSTNHVYCSPNKLWEYPRSGVPILCSDAPEMAKRVKQFGHGFLVPSRRLDGATIAAVINGLTDEQIGEARQACRRYIEADNWSTYAERLRTLYEGLGLDTTSSRQPTGQA